MFDFSSLASISQLKAKGKVVFLRIDVNGSDLRIAKSAETISYLQKKGAKVVVLAHRGRPEGIEPRLSLEPLVELLSASAECDIHFLPVSSGDSLTDTVGHMHNGDVVLLENVRFDPREAHPIGSLLRQWALLADAFVFDGFAVSHRETASTTGLIRIGVPSYIGPLMKKELSVLNKVRKGKLKKPRLAVIAGKKIDTKLPVIETLIDSVDVLLIGGALAHCFMVARGIDVKKSYIQLEYIAEAKRILALTEAKKVLVCIPEDYVWNAKDAIVDLGPKSIKKFVSEIKKAESIIWNGNLGVTDEGFEEGTTKIARAISNRQKYGAFTLVGGGDTVEFLEQLRIKQERFSHVSTGGGAMIEYLS